MGRIAEFPDPLTERQKEVAGRIATGPRGRVRGPLAMWLHSPDFAEHAQQLGELLRYGTAFEKRLSELAILVVSSHLGCAYIWSIHAPIARDAGIAAEVVEALRGRRRPEFEHDDERIVHDFIVQLLRDNRVEQPIFDALLERFGERGVVELTGIMGYYSMGSHLLNAVELETPDGSRPFAGADYV